jgi:hypothetical protein
MKALRLTKEWHSPTGILRPGEYAIPKGISMTLARCARADGAGEIIAAASFLSTISTSVDAAFAGKRKGTAPENKRGRDAPENKSEV